eukprot:TRINITY_DN22564_c0_g1_i1.p2 TRINITY_DN22564_c0_g1~~TRINITY_DN22564_c0_g1_i1.p2  ORF type:complete len:384 (+),score=51.18 TRINITY_DN22564_c0_g1_i1:59-1153(+)
MHEPPAGAASGNHGSFTASGTADEETAPACSGVLALRRITTLLSSARKAESSGEVSKAKREYGEVIKIQQSLARAPLGSMGKTLKEVVAGVEVRLTALNQELPSSRPATSSRTSALASASAKVLLGPPSTSGGLTGAWVSPAAEAAGERPCTREGSALGGARPSTRGRQGPSSLSEGRAPLSAREGRPDTRGGRQPPLSARDPGDGGGGGRSMLERGSGSGRPATREGSGDRRSAQSGLAFGLDGTRPSTRDGVRLQGLIGGSSTKAPLLPEEEFPIPGCLEIPLSARVDGRPPRPQTRDEVLKPLPKERRCGDVRIRKLSSRRRKQELQQSSEAQEFDVRENSPVARSPSLGGGGEDEDKLLE